MIASRDGLRKDLEGIASLVLTGSGSSEYAAECVCFALQNELGIPTESISGGTLLMYRGKALPPRRPGLLISLARSGDSPESRAVVELLLTTDPQIRHVVVTCNEQGKLAKAWHETEDVRVITLPSETLDKSLVMTAALLTFCWPYVSSECSNKRRNIERSARGSAKSRVDCCDRSSLCWQRLRRRISAVQYSLAAGRASRPRGRPR